MEISGTGLFGGKSCSVQISARLGPTALETAGVRGKVTDFSPVRAVRTTAVGLGGAELRGVEHLFAALGGLGLHAGIDLRVSGDELPILDGGAATWCGALLALGAKAAAPSLAIAREGEVRVLESVYRFAPGGAPHVSVAVDFGDVPIAREAAWAGDRDDFVSRIAPARTFALASEIDGLVAAGLRASAPPESVVLVTPAGLLAAGTAAADDEPVRHKLLDLVGDLFLHGGPPRGRVDAVRPGHAATHEAIAEALRAGILVKVD